MDLLLIKLARFITFNEQRGLLKDLERIFTPLTNSFHVTFDEWGAKHRILAQLALLNINYEEICQKLLETPGINTVIHFSPSLFNMTSSSLSALISQLSAFLKDSNPGESYDIDFHSIGRVPFHKKAIIDRLQRKRFTYRPDSKFHLYLEIRSASKKRKNTSETHLQVRIGQKFMLKSSFEKTRKIIPRLILYSPFTYIEIADFFRLGLVFNSQIILTNENNRVEKLLKEVQKSYFKGISKVSFEIVPSLDTVIAENLGMCFGFSLWGKKSVNDLSQKILTLIKQEPIKPIVNLIFGNEKTGIPLSVRQKISIFQIGDRVSEPLRSSQAAAYILGTLYSL